MKCPLYRVDAFASAPFTGNPAAVCLLPSAQTEQWMQKVAAEMNISETAFVVPRGDGFTLRWFTPAVEVALCGHATLASAHALWDAGKARREEILRFHTASGVLTARISGENIEIDLPAMPLIRTEISAEVVKALGVRPRFIGRTPERGLEDRDILIEVDAEETVRTLRPDVAALGRLLPAGVIVTARAEPGSPYDFISRYFAPYAGIDEDPVTGAAHCALAPYWGSMLRKSVMTGFQASRRGGILHTTVKGERVVLAGSAITTMRGELVVPPW